MNRGLRSVLLPGARGPPEENEIMADRVQTTANEIGQKASNTVDDNVATKAGGKAVEEVREIGPHAAEAKIQETNMGNKVEESEQRWS